MIFRIAHIHEVISFSEHVTQALWMMELHFLKVAINQANFTIAYYCLTLHRLLIYD